MVTVWILSSCYSPTFNQPTETSTTQAETPDSNESEAKEAVRQATDEMLFLVGNYNHNALAEVSLPYTNIGMAGSGKSMTLQQYFDLVNENKNPIPYYEPAHRYTIEISEDRLAFVRAECYLYRLGVRRSFEDDFFIFIKNDNLWKLLSASYTARRLPEAEQVFDLEAFAKSYAQVWGSTRPEFVALFFAEDGAIAVNEGDPATGRDEITDFARSFMVDIPDMRVLFDSLVSSESTTQFHWTLVGTHGASGNKIKVSGYEEWILSEDQLILESQGHFPSAIYEDQINNGTAN